ncbi:MAG TPA: hypothetical protein VGE55_07445 [Limnobacter sp.]|uniref:hypothetical protein n=1 Tax=Limnobacter sp. TaxID=2003368 RepID=UPI002EDA8E1F
MRTKASPKQLILGLMLAAKGKPVKAAHMVLAGQLFGVSENHVRVALTRLTGEGFLRSVSRGVYALGAKAVPTGDDVKDWTSRLTAPANWTGRFLAAYTAHLGRKDRQQVQLRERALALYGFREFHPGLYVRPDNLQWGIDGVETRLHDKGLDPEATLFLMLPRDARQVQTIQKLWDVKKLERFYKTHADKMNQWLGSYGKMPLERAAKEAYLLGSEGIYQVRHDPLLPAEWLDTTLRRAFFNCVQQFDHAGHVIWHTLQQRILKDETPLY